MRSKDPAGLPGLHPDGYFAYHPLFAHAAVMGHLTDTFSGKGPSVLPATAAAGKVTPCRTIFPCRITGRNI